MKYLLLICTFLAISTLASFEVIYAESSYWGEFDPEISKPIGDGYDASILNSTENILEFSDYTKYETTKTLPNGDEYKAKKYVFSGGTQNIYEDFSIKGDNGTVTYLKNGEFIEVDILSDLPCEMLYIKTNQEEMMISPLFYYKNVEDGSYKYIPFYNVSLKFVKTDTGYVATGSYPNIKGLELHLWTLKSTETLLSLEDENYSNAWASYAQTETQRYLYDGYYWETPSTYKPYSDNMFWRNPSSYSVSGFIQTGGSRASDDLGYAMLETILLNFEDEGYILTPPESGWLKKDYDIEGDFYDTRFNTDITETLFRAYQKTGDEKFLIQAEKQLEFFMEFATKQNYSFTVDGVEGILVEDYYQKDPNYKKTHSSLNHQLAEIYVLYLAYNITEDIKYFDFAEYLMQGIRNTEDLWLKNDGSLEYAYMPNGKMGLTDYPYLTYNDLFEVQKMREFIGIARDECLDRLMLSKKSQMDRDEITGYRK